MMNDQRLVTIAIPTYNRARSLERAAQSALAQTHAHLELVVSDDASSDATTELCMRLAMQDRRVRYFRHDTNIGLSRNFACSFAQSSGAFFMWLADDDWLDPDYVATCLQAFDTCSRLAIACGRVTYECEGHVLRSSRPVSLQQAPASIRVLSFFREVEDNPALYGLMRRRLLSSVPPMKQAFGDDWLLIASMAFRGPIVTLPDTALHRSASGLSGDVTTLARYYGFSGRSATNPYNRLAWAVFRDIAWESPAYRALSPIHRSLLGVACAAVTCVRHNAISWRIRYLGPLKRRARRTMRHVSHFFWLVNE